MNTFYVVVETQIDGNGTKGVLTTAYDDVNAALNKYYTVLAAASVSTIPYHAGCIIRSDGIMTEGRVFDRRVEPGASIEEE